VSPVTGGALQVLGMDPAADGSRIRALLGVVPQDNALDVNLTVRDNLHIYGRYFGLSRHAVRERAAELLEFVHLTDRADDRVDALSGGMRRRLAIARSLINEPEILLLDEPTTGLDPQARHLLWDRLFRLKQRGVTLVLTTHYPLSEYAPELRVLVQVTPLYQGIELLRALTTGTVGPGLLGHVAYLAAMGAISLRVATHRLERRLRI
jgi:ABC-type multidrug transport system ATPase subunit